MTVASAGIGTGNEISQAGEVRSRRIESARAIAALAVLVGHVWAVSLAFRGLFDGYGSRLLIGGGMGVHLFFVLSGYLLFWPFARAMFGDNAPTDLRRYARNRALRILPLYYAVIFILLVFQPLDASRSDWWRFALFIQNYSPRTIFKLDSPMWSLAVEVQFYILLPLIAGGVALIARRSLARGAAVIGLFGIASAVLRWWQVLRHGDAATPTDFLAGYASFSTLFFLFATGMLICLLRLHWERKPPRWLATPLGRAEVWIGAAILGWAVVVWDRSWVMGIAVPSFLLVGACVLPMRGGVAHRVMESRWLARVGVISYSLFLLHVPLIFAMIDKVTFRRPDGGTGVRPAHEVSFFKLLVATLVVSLTAATIGYFAIERPFLLRRRRWSRSAARLEAEETPSPQTPAPIETART